MQVRVNGEEKKLSAVCTLADALLQWGYTHDMPIAVAIDSKVIPKQDHATVMLSTGNAIEILMPMQGG